MTKKQRGIYTLYVILGVLFCFFQITGKKLAQQGNILWTATETGKILGLSLLAGAALGLTLCFLLEHRKKKPAGAWLLQSVGNLEPKKRDLITLASFGLIMLSRMPAYLAYYPGIYAYDTSVQLEQIALQAYNDHHPLIHTLLLEATLNLGRQMGNVNLAFGLLSLAQVLFMSLVMALAVRFYLHKRASRLAVLLLQLFFMIYPFHRYMTLSCCKDVLFTGFFLLLLMDLDAFAEKRTLARWIRTLLLAMFMQLFRNNGRYVILFLLGMAFLSFLFTRKEKKAARKLSLVLAAWSLTALVLGVLASSGLAQMTQAGAGDKREMLSMPIQQLARTMLYHEDAAQQAAEKEAHVSPWTDLYYANPEVRTPFAEGITGDSTMSEKDMNLIRDFLLATAYLEYRPEFADPVKGATNTYVVRYRLPEFSRTYLGLLKQYPGDFVNAALALDAGYLYLGDTSHAMVTLRDKELGHGYAQTMFDEDALVYYGLTRDSKWPAFYEKAEVWAGTNRYLHYGPLKLLFVPAAVIYGFLLCFAAFVRRGNRTGRLLLYMPLGLILTLFLGPVVTIRYMYPLICALPLCLYLGHDER